MALGFRATVLVAFTLVSAALVVSSAALGDTPEWQRDLDYLTWDRRAECANAAAGGPVYLQPEGQRTAAVSNAPAPTWQLRVRDFYSIVTPRGLRSMWSRGEETQGAPATLTVPAPGLAVEQPVGAVARRNELPMHGSIVR
jgi:hypothetical protein